MRTLRDPPNGRHSPAERLAKAALIGLSMAMLDPSRSMAACDELVGRILTRHLRPVIENADCSIPGRAGLDKKDHKLISLCYESSGSTSRIRLDAVLSCRSGDDSVASRILGKNAPSISEDVAVEAEVRGTDCTLTGVHVGASGEVGKALASLFDADGRARTALEQGLSEVCQN